MLFRGVLCLSLLLLLACKKVETQKDQLASAAVVEAPKSKCVLTKLPSPPALKGWVTDAADVINQDEEERLSKRFVDWEKSSGHQVVAVTIPTLSGVAIDTYACNLANAWGVGDKDRNDGVLILYAMDKREVRIAIGKGLESRLSNAFLLDVIQQNMVPELRGAHYAKATDVALDKIAQKLAD